MKDIEIAGRLVGMDHPPYIVAEVSANHGQSFEKAVKMLHEAKKAGADAVKFQTYTPDSMTVDCDLPAYMHSETSLWKGLSLYNLYKKASTPYEWFKPLFKEAAKLEIPIFSSVFDSTAIDFMEQFDPPCYKIATLEMVDLPLIKKAASTGKPIILSTGASTIEEIQEAVDAAHSVGNKKLILLKCISAYPAPINEANLATIPDMQKRFNTLIGISDHTVSTLTSILSVALGSCLIEKHFVLSKDEPAIDDAFSLDLKELRSLVQESKQAFQARGVVHYGPTIHEKDNFRFRRSLICAKNIQKGELLTPENVKSLRPCIGLPPKYLESVMGTKAKIDLKKGDPINWDVIS